MTEASTSLVRQGFSSRVVGPSYVERGKLLVVAEAPGRTEDATGITLHPEAEAGGLFTRLMHRVGVEREGFVLANCVWQRPPNNELYDSNGDRLSYTDEAVEYWKPALLELIEQVQPPVIIGLGRTALELLTGFSDIGTTRGYVHDAKIAIEPDCHELNIPCLCTYHPAFLVRGMQKLSGVFIRDVLTALELAQTGWTRPSLPVTPTPSPEAFEAFWRIYNPEVHKLTYDIENPDSRAVSEDDILEGKREISFEIDRMSFCFDEQVGGYSIPFVEPYITMAKGLMASPGPKRGHNSRLHDDPRLESHGFVINGRRYDTLDLWRHLHRTLPASVAYIAPFYLNMSPWKQEAHVHPEFYSAMDAVVQHHIAEGIERSARQLGQWEVMERHVVDIIGPAGVCTQMAKNGLPIDQVALAEFQKELEAKARERQEELQQLVPGEIKPVKQKQGLKRVPKSLEGYVRRSFELKWPDLIEDEKSAHMAKEGLPREEWDDIEPTCVVQRWALLQPFNPNSHVQVKALIRHWSHKPKTDRKTRGETSNDDTLKSLIATYLESRKESDQKAVTCYRLIRDCRAIAKVLGTYVKGWRPDADGLIHAIPGVWGEMFRISWRKPNLAATVADKKELQIAAGFRKCIRVPDDQVITEVDWKGMESVIVAYLAQDHQYMRLARLSPHAYLASHLLGRPADLAWSDSDLGAYLKEIKGSSDERVVKVYDDAKHTIHGISYGMTPFLMAELYEMTRVRAAQLQSMFFEVVAPKVRQWQQAIQQEAHEKAKLVNPWGYCVAPDTLVLTSELLWKPAGELLVGERLLAFDEFPPVGRRARQYRHGEILAAYPVEAEVAEVELSNGDVIVTTPDHRWLVAIYNSSKYGWCATRDLRPGQRVMKTMNTWDVLPDREAGWLAGIFDGEGHLACTGKPRTGANLGMAQRAGTVLTTTQDTLLRFGFTFGQKVRNTDGCHSLVVAGGLAKKLEFLGSVRPLRLLQKAANASFGEMQSREDVRVKRVTPCGIRTVTMLTTTTQTFIAKGYAMHNCMPFWDVFKWQQRRYDGYRKLWVRWRTGQGQFSKPELTVLEKIDVGVAGGLAEDRAIGRLCWAPGDEAKSALAFLPRDIGAAMLKDALLTLRDEYGLDRQALRACAHDAIMAITSKVEADRIAEIMQSVMERPQALLGGLVIYADVKQGQSWDKKAMNEWKPLKEAVGA